METTKCLIAAALMLPMPNAYAETQAASHMITTAAAISLYKILRLRTGKVARELAVQQARRVPYSASCIQGCSYHSSLIVMT